MGPLKICIPRSNVDGHGLSNSSLVMSLSNNKEDDDSDDDVVPVEDALARSEVGDARGGVDVEIRGVLSLGGGPGGGGGGGASRSILFCLPLIIIIVL